MAKPFIVTFAGVPGVSKSPISNYLSCEFNLPIFNNDQIRYEVREDLRLKSINDPGGVEEFEKRASTRQKKLFAERTNVIFDSSIDRRWADLKKQLKQANYDWFIIDLELSKAFLLKLYKQTGRSEWADQHLEAYMRQHKEFVDAYDKDVNLHITDETFPARLQESARALQEFIKAR